MNWKERATPINTKSKSLWKDRATSISTDDNAPKSLEELDELEGNIAMSTGSGALSGVTLGLNDEIGAAIKNPFGAGKEILNKFGAEYNDADVAGYKSERNELREMNNKAYQANPKAYLGGELLGGTALTFIPGVGALNLAKGANIGTRVLKAGAGGAINAMGLSEKEDLAGIAKDAETGFKIGGVMQGAGEQVAPLFESARKMAPKAKEYLLKKFGSVVGDIPQEVTQEYLDRKGQISARPKVEIFDEIAGRANTAGSQLENAREQLGINKDSFNSAQNKFNLDQQDTRFNKQEAGFNSRMQLKDAKQNLDDTFRTVKEELRTSNSQGLRGQITDGIDNLSKQINEGSREAFNVLDNVETPISLTGASEVLEKEMGKFLIKGTTPTNSASKAYNNLAKLKDRLGQLGEEISPYEAKRLIQSLDADIKLLAGENNIAAQSAVSSVRSHLDEAVKTLVPEYKDAMVQVAERMELLNKLNQSFGSDSAIVNRIEQMATEKGRQIDLPLLNRLEQYTGQEITPGIKKSIDNAMLLKSPERLEQTRRALPEYQDYSRLSAENQELLRPQQKVMSSPEMDAAQAQLTAAEEAVTAAKEKYNTLKPFGEQKIEGRANALTSDKNSYGATQQFKELDEVTGQNYSSEIRDRALLDQFNKPGSPNGGKLGLAGTAIGAGVGSILGPAGAVAGGAIGGAAGVTINKNVGSSIKSLLDGSIKFDQLSEEVLTKLGPYGKHLQKAIERGGKSAAATDAVLQQTDPEYRKLKNLNGDGEDGQ